MLCGRRGTCWHRPSFCVAGVALGDTDLTTTFLIGGLFFVIASLWNARGFQSTAPVNKSDVCLVSGGLMICSILCSKVRSKWLCSKVMLQTAFQSDPVTMNPSWSSSGRTYLLDKTLQSYNPGNPGNWHVHYFWSIRGLTRNERQGHGNPKLRCTYLTPNLGGMHEILYTVMARHLEYIVLNNIQYNI